MRNIKKVLEVLRLAIRKLFLEELKKLIKKKEYHPKQVFTSSETGLFLEKCEVGTRVQSLEGQITLVLFGKAAKRMIKIPSEKFSLPQKLKTKSVF